MSESGAVYKVKSKGPKTDPCGTPELQKVDADVDESIRTA